MLLPLLVGAQGFGSFSHDQPFLAKDAAGGGTPVDPNDPSTIAGLAYRWVARDLESINLQTNLVVTNWYDRIQGISFWNAASGSSPTNSGDAVGFSGTTFLTNTVWSTNINSALGGPLSSMVILKRTQPRALCYYYGSYPLTAHSGFLLNQGTFHAGTHWERGTAAVLPISSAVGTNVVLDFVINDKTGVGGGSDCYTNGVLSLTFAGGLWELCTFNIVGGKDTSTTSQFFIGYVYEICIWTNTLTSGNATTLHAYRTNVYGGSP